jgi:uncharacterized protein YrrD
MPVVTADEGTRIGIVEGVEIDPPAARIAYLRVNQSGPGGHSVLPWREIQSVGQDVVVIRSATALQREVPASQRSLLTPHVGDRPVVTASGDRLGRVNSYEVDEMTGAIGRYRITGLLATLSGSAVTFPPESILTFGRDAIIVEDAVARRHPDTREAKEEGARAERD